MGITVETTPNPRAMKFNVGSPVGETATATSTDGADERIAPLFDIDGVMSVFMTADFVTVTRTEDAEWDGIVPAVSEVLSRTFG
ncbi:MAG: NifU N-terminal domain-containing protein [Acidimicrobiia bacterium]